MNTVLDAILLLTMEYTSPRLVLLSYGIVITSVYLYTAYPTITGGDSGELIQAAHELGVAHPPGYPLFTMLCWLAIKVIPWGPVAWRTNILCVLFSGTAATILAFTIHKYTDNVWTAMTGTALWSFGQLSWTWSSQTEVFSLNNLFVSLIMYLMVEFQTTGRDKQTSVSLLGCFVCGLALCNQHTIVLYVILVAAWVLSELWTQKKITLTLLIQMGLCFVLGLIPYIYLPISSAMRPGRWTLGNQTTLQGFLFHLLRVEYGTFDLAKGLVRKEGAFLNSIWAYLSHVREDFGVTACILALLVIVFGHKWIDRSVRRCLCTKVTMALVYITFFCWRGNLGVEKNTLDRGVVERFWLQCDMVFILLVSLGLYIFPKMVKARFPSVSENKLSVYLFLALSSAQFLSGIRSCNNRDNTVIAEYGRRVIRSMPNNSLVLLHGDLPSNVLRYFYLCENERPDIEMFDLEVLGSEYGADMLRDKYPRIKLPGKRLSIYNGELSTGIHVFDIKTFLDANLYRFSSIINCNTFRPDHTSWKSSYLRYPYGNCWMLMPVGSPIDAEQIIRDTNGIHEGWPYRYDQFDRSTWENTANKDIWIARTEIANKIFEDSNAIEDTTTKHSLQTRAFKIYNYQIGQQKGNSLPGHWHRNYAIILHTLFKREIEENTRMFQLPREDVLDMILFHFTAYNQLEPTDNDHESIVNLMNKLEQVRDLFHSSGKWIYD